MHKDIVGPFSKYFVILVASSQRLIHTKKTGTLESYWLAAASYREDNTAGLT